MKRTVIPELLDQDSGTPAEIEASLNDLRHINEWFGGLTTTVKLVRRVAEGSCGKELSLLEIGSGRGDLPLQTQRVLRAEGTYLRVTLLDFLPSHLPSDGTQAVAGNAMKPPFRDGSFDIVSCCLFAHHFEPQELQALASSALRVCRRAVIINDLIRSPLHLALTYAGLPLFRSRITWHDAPASVRRAYTRKEMSNILQPLSARRVEITSHYLYRMGVILWK
jgi:ubiquinone/menaquinone biosynthesis C-methylase UbiE